MRHPQRNLVLTGFYCAGKTTVARELGKRMRRPVVDWDQEVNRRAPFDLRALWPHAFERQLDREAVERRLINDLSYRRETIIAFGSEAVAVPDYVNELKDFAYTVFLDLPWESLWQRIQNDSSLSERRESLGEQGLRELYLGLRDHYMACDLQIFAGMCSPQRCSQLILHCFYT